jgi:hypothetical protein
MLHPPKLTCQKISYRDRTMPAVLHNAFQASDGRDAMVLANATREPQTAMLLWKGRELRLQLKPGEIRLEK